MAVRVLVSDCLDVLPTLGACSVDAIVTDPPAGIGFMGVGWDTYSTPKGGPRTDAEWDWSGSKERARTADAQVRVVRKQGRLFRESMAPAFEECLRVLKPGGHALVWGLPRTSYWTATALEDAGFEIRDVIVHLFGTGFPKSASVSKQIDKAAGAEREVIGQGQYASRNPRADHSRQGSVFADDSYVRPPGQPITAPATDAARQWDGWGTALKPASEHWILCRKPLAEPTVAANVLEHGTGALNIDGCRLVGTKDVPASPSRLSGHSLSGSADGSLRRATGQESGFDPNVGRWPANVVLSHSEDCEAVGTRQVANRDGATDTQESSTNTYGWAKGGIQRKGVSRTGLETVESYACVDGCPVALLDAQSGERPVSGSARNGRPAARRDYKTGMFGAGGFQGPLHNDTGGASRFFYTAKSSSAERNAGCEHLGGNTHPTVKSLALMRYLCRLITPPGGTILDPFAGSGSTLCAAVLEGFNAIGIEREVEYAALAQARTDHWSAQMRQLGLFGVEAAR